MFSRLDQAILTLVMSEEPNTPDQALGQLQIHVWVESRQPLSGHAAIAQPIEGGRNAIPFQGWLGCIRVLSELVGVELHQKDGTA